MIEIKVVKLDKLKSKGSLKALVDIAVADFFVIKGLRIIESKRGLFVSMPREQGKDGLWYQTVYPLSEEFKNMLDEIVLQAYQE